MKKALRWTAGLVAMVLVVWIGAAGLVWNRNRLPSLALPSVEARPANNVYNDYLQCVRDLKVKDKLTQVQSGMALDDAARRELLEPNRAMLTRFHSLAGRPAMATELEPGVDFLPFGQLIALEVQETLPSDPKKALTLFLDGFAFADDMQHGGTTLHLMTSYLALIPLFQAFPASLPLFDGADCQVAADRLRALLDKQYPLPRILQNERRVRISQLVRSLEPQGGRLFRFQFPGSKYEWDYLLKPKTPALTALNDYLAHWEEEAAKPLQEINAPPAPAELSGILTDETLQPEFFGKEIARYRYLQARLGLVYAALRLEAYRKAHGQYPTALSDLSDASGLRDPFSGQPFVYSRNGDKYTLYSVGANGKDDGGITAHEARLNPDGKGDLLLQPKFH